MCLGLYDNLEVICNAKYDSIIYKLVSQHARIKEGLPTWEMPFYGDFRQAGEAENLYAVHRRPAKAGRLLHEV